MIFFYTLLLTIGFTALIKGADFFVDGSSSLARHFHVPGLIIGLTIVALGTSAPELAVSVSAALQNANEIAFSNVVGSNIFNLLCVLGVCAILQPLPVEPGILRRDFPLSIGSSLLLFFLLLPGLISSNSVFQGIVHMNDITGTITRGTGILFVVLFSAYIIYLIVRANKNPVKETPTACMPWGTCFFFIFAGLILIVAGGQVTVAGAKGLARIAGMSETLIGLTVVAVGTSLPELVTSVVAARKGEAGLAVGNVIGSNLFNLLFILGISAAIHPVTVTLASICDLTILTAVSLIAYGFSISQKSIRRSEGVIMILIYVASVVFAAVR